MVAEAAGVSRPTAYKLIDRFVQQGLLVGMTGAKRERLFRFGFDPGEKAEFLSAGSRNEHGDTLDDHPHSCPLSDPEARRNCRDGVTRV